MLKKLKAMRNGLCVTAWLVVAVVSAIYTGFIGLAFWVGATWLTWSLVVHFQEEKEYNKKLADYKAAGGRPWTNRKHCKTKAEESAWDEQDEINRTARVIAGLEPQSTEN